MVSPAIFGQNCGRQHHSPLRGCLRCANHCMCRTDVSRNDELHCAVLHISGQPCRPVLSAIIPVKGLPTFYAGARRWLSDAVVFPFGARCVPPSYRRPRTATAARWAAPNYCPALKYSSGRRVFSYGFIVYVVPLRTSGPLIS